MKTAYIALGANLGNPKESLRKAAEKIKDLDGVPLLRPPGFIQRLLLILRGRII